MKLAGFNGFRFHYELFGYIIHYCITNNHELTIYCHIQSMGDYIEIYKGIFSSCSLEFKELSEFDREKHNYDAIVLFTDDDGNYNARDPIIANKTICIDHYYKIRRPQFKHHISTRPYSDEHSRDWALPTYPIISNRDLTNENEINIVLIGGDARSNYRTDILNRIKSPNDKQIRLHVIRRFLNASHLENLDARIQLCIHENICTTELFELCKNSNYAITDVSESLDYEARGMSGAIPLYFSLLLPFIISKQTNQYYNFKNVIEFDKCSNDDILLTDIDISLMKKERDELIDHNFGVISNILTLIHEETISK